MSRHRFSTLVFLILAAILSYASAAHEQSSVSLANNTELHSLVVLGASGDLAKRMIYPALWSLYREKLLPVNTVFYGFARSDLKVSDLRKKVEPFIQVNPSEERLYEEFWSKNRYVRNYKTEDEGYNNLCGTLKKTEVKANGGNRIFYLALPPAVFESSAAQVKRACIGDRGWTRVIVEKPFGQDSQSSEKLSKHLAKLFTEDQIYRVDHFLGKEMVQNLLALRFGNRLLSAAWNRDNIAAVKIDFRENFGIEGRGSFFEKNGIIRDVMQNHLIQLMSLIAMEQPASSHSNDVRNEKVKLLKSTRSILLTDVVLGQYVGNPKSPVPSHRLSYADEANVPKDSRQSTFALTVLKVDNERWRGVPFIIRAGKGLNKNITNILVQFKNVDKDIFHGKSKRNELIISIDKTHSLKAKIMMKKPGFTSDIGEIPVSFDFDEACKNLYIPKAYERLILDILHGSHLNFVRADELSEAWRIFTPILHEIESKKVRPIKYTFGSTGPKAADVLEKKYNFL